MHLASASSESRARAWFLVLALTLLPTATFAGQMRISLNSESFSLSNVPVNVGDHVTWVWLAGAHSVTSGADPDNPDGTFDTGTRTTGGTGSNTAFSWRATTAGTQPFFCLPHFETGMVGTVQVVASGASVADFRITEVLYNDAGGLDKIEITNFGTATGDLGRFRLAIPGDAEGIPLGSLSVAPNGVVVVNPGQSGSSSVDNVFMPALSTLPDAVGSLALYVPNTVVTALTDVSQIIDFVQWGAGGQANEATAVAANLWVSGEFLPTVGGAGRSIEFCGARPDRGVSHWAEIAVPNFGADDDCATGASTATWGRIKVRYH